MAVVIPPGFAQCSIEHWLDGYPRPAVTTMGVKIAGTEEAGGNVADRFWQAYNTAFVALTDNGVRIRNARAVIGQDGGDPIIQESTKEGPGGQARSSLAPALALMLTKSTAVGGRKNRGRMYIPWAMDDNAVGENGAILPIIVTAWTTASQVFLDYLSLGEHTNQDLIDGAYILHSDSTPPTPVTKLAPNPTIRTQRNRQTRY